MLLKAKPKDMAGRFREILSDPLNLLIRRVPEAGHVQEGEVCLLNGHRVATRGPHAYYGGFSDILIYNRGVHEPLEELAFQEMLPRLPERPVILELGSFWAHYSMWILQARPAGRAFMVEPEPGQLAAGQHNFARNGYVGTFEQAYVGAGQLTVDGYLGRQGIDRLDVLHSDIQGFETEMLDGAAGLLGRQGADHVFISTHSQSGHQEIVARMQGFGYRIDANSPFNRHTTSHDGLVLAVRPGIPRYMPGQIMGRVAIAEASPDEVAAYVSRIRDDLAALRGKAGLPMP
ncbi:MAG: FkbM family methyltransferase [Rubellimicrobium sp.]|nr:FkbM family methyltransferase [Rubellimicrobium sp.]